MFARNISRLAAGGLALAGAAIGCTEVRRLVYMEKSDPTIIKAAVFAFTALSGAMLSPGRLHDKLFDS